VVTPSIRDRSGHHGRTVHVALYLDFLLDVLDNGVVLAVAVHGPAAFVVSIVPRRPDGAVPLDVDSCARPFGDKRLAGNMAVPALIPNLFNV